MLLLREQETGQAGPVRSVLLQWRAVIREAHATVVEKKKSCNYGNIQAYTPPNNQNTLHHTHGNIPITEQDDTKSQ